MSTDQLRNAIEAIKTGETDKGRDILYEVIGEDPKNEMAWMWLATCQASIEQKIQCLEKVIEINPNNANARAGIEKLKPRIVEPDIDSIIASTPGNDMDTLSNQISQKINNPRAIQFLAANCPNCGGELRVPSDRNSVKCMYCGHEVIIHDPTRIDVNLRMKVDISKPLKLAQVSEESGNYEDGYKYYSQVLEQDSENITAWLGKARCVVWRASVQSQTLDEAISYVKTAQALGKVSEKDLFLTIGQIAKATAAYTVLVGEFLEEENKAKSPHQRTPDGLEAIAVGIGSANVLKQTNKKFFDIYFQIIYRIINQCWEFAPTEVVGGAIFQTITNIRHISILNQDTMFSVDGNLEKIINAIHTKYPDIPLPEKKKSCYIATAVMGDIDHPYIETLRQFRDQILTKSPTGKAFIRIYYRISPPLAMIIAKNKYLRKITRTIIVEPFYRLSLRELNQKDKKPSMS